MQRADEGRYTITLDADPNIHSAIAKATGYESKWFSTSEQLNESNKLEPVAIFVDVRLSVESSQNGQLIPKLKDSWPLSPLSQCHQS